MKIVHTSDWHVGRRWKGTDRLQETARVLTHLGDFIEREKVDLVLHTGDVFDGRTPEGDAEELVNRFFVRMRKLEVDMVVIAGNHDDPDRFEARAHLASLANVRLIGHPKSVAKGGTMTIETRRGQETAIVAALPFAAAGNWASALDLARDESASRSKYAEMFQKAVTNLSSLFREGAVNLLMAHTHLHGVPFGNSERSVHLGTDWAATSQALPSTANYVALGHIHKPQAVAGLVPTYYAGSPMQMDFGEVGQKKTFAFVTAAAGKLAKVEHVAYEGAWPLVDLEGTLEHLASIADAHRTGSWQRVKVHVTEKDPDLGRKVRRLLPNATVITDNLPEPEEVTTPRLPASATPEEHYAAFHLREHQQPPSSAVAGTFRQLYGLALDGEK